MAKTLNPISKKLKNLVESGKTSYEAICVASDIKYNNFMNIFKRNRISPFIMRSLQLARLVTKDDVDAYKEWQVTSGKRKNTDTEFEEQDFGNEEDNQD